MTTFSLGATSVIIAQNPALGLSLPVSTPQVGATDSLGNRYVYGHGATTRTVNLIFSVATDDEKTAINNFFSTTTDAGRRTFTWTDHLAVDHNVRRLSHKWQRRGINWWRIEIDMEETL